LACEVRVASSTRSSSTPRLQLQSTATSALRTDFCVGFGGGIYTILRSVRALLGIATIFGSAARAGTTALNADAKFDLHSQDQGAFMDDSQNE